MLQAASPPLTVVFQKGFLSAQVFSLSRGLLKGPLLGAKFPASSRHAMFCWNALFIDSGMRCASNDDDDDGGAEERLG